MAMNQTNIDATIGAAEEDNKQTLRDITDPTTGLITDEYFNASNLNRNFNDIETNFKLENSVQKVLDDVLENVSRKVEID